MKKKLFLLSFIFFLILNNGEREEKRKKKFQKSTLSQIWAWIKNGITTTRCFIKNRVIRLSKNRITIVITHPTAHTHVSAERRKRAIKIISFELEFSIKILGNILQRRGNWSIQLIVSQIPVWKIFINSPEQK